MKLLQRLSRLFWRRRELRNPPVSLQPAIDPEEFARLLCSRRKEDLRTLAKRLSQEPRAHA
jgi:hypothetical protein